MGNDLTMGSRSALLVDESPFQDTIKLEDSHLISVL